MQIVNSYPQGIFSWNDLGTTDAEGAKQFYTQLFGWSAIDIPLPMGGVYTMLQLNGLDVAGLGQLQPDQIAQGMPSSWTCYINVDDVDEMSQKSADAGANIIAPPFDVMEQGRMAIIQDPTGAIVGYWQPKNHTGASIKGIPSTVAWYELATRNLEGAKDFYTTVFGWEARRNQDNYMVFAQNGEDICGAIEITPEWGEVPPYWAMYLTVENLSESCTRAEALGGKIIVPATPAGGMGFFALISDPQGAMFYIMEFSSAE